MGVSKKRVFSTPNHPLKNRLGFSIIFTIHFGGFSHYFGKHPYVKQVETTTEHTIQVLRAPHETAPTHSAIRSLLPGPLALEQDPVVGSLGVVVIQK